MRVVAVVQARMASTRLPGKVLERAAGRSLLAHVVERLRAARNLDAVVVATSDGAADEPVAAEAARLGVGVHRGSEQDVLDRFVGAARAATADAVVRITADCPLLDPGEVDRVVSAFRAPPEVDYATNHPAEGRRVPLGQAVEVIAAAALERAGREATLPYQREHVTPYLYDAPGRFRVRVTQPEGEDLGHVRLTVDTPEDLVVARALLEALEGPARLSLGAALRYLDAHPELSARNAAVKQKTFREVAVPAPEAPGVSLAASIPPLVLRADASPRIGAGHAMRVLALAEAWIALGGAVSLASAELPEALASRFTDAGVAVAALPPVVAAGSRADADATVAVVRATRAALLVIDGYPLGDATYLAALRGPDHFTAYIDDHILADLPVDAVVSPSPAARPAMAGSGAGPAVLSGVGYALLRAEFRARRLDRRFDARPLRLLVCFGGSDATGLTTRTVRAARAGCAAGDIALTVLLGPAAPESLERDVAAAAAPHVPRVVRDPSSVASLYEDVDLAVAASGVSAWELACVGVPTLLTWVADNQRPVAESLAAAGAARDLGPASGLDDARLAGEIAAFVALGPERHRPMSEAGAALVDGRGAERVARELHALASGRGRQPS